MRFSHRRLLYGSNAIVVPLHSVYYLLVKQILNPFYVFQVNKGAHRHAVLNKFYAVAADFIPTTFFYMYHKYKCLFFFFRYKVASVTLWFTDEYYAYAFAIVLMSAFGITTFIYQTRKV